GVEGQQPDGGDAQPRDVVERLDQAGEVADAVRVGVAEGSHVQLVDDRVLVPGRDLVLTLEHSGPPGPAVAGPRGRGPASPPGPARRSSIRPCATCTWCRS